VFCATRRDKIACRSHDYDKRGIVLALPCAKLSRIFAIAPKSLFFDLRRDLTGECCCPERGSRSLQRHSWRFWCWLSAADRPGASGPETAARRPVSRASNLSRSFTLAPLTLGRYRSLPSRVISFFYRFSRYLS